MDMIMSYKILHGFVDLPVKDFNQVRAHSQPQAGHECALGLPKTVCLHVCLNAL